MTWYYCEKVDLVATGDFAAGKSAAVVFAAASVSLRVRKRIE